MSSFSWCCGEAGRDFRMQSKEGSDINVRMPNKQHDWSINCHQLPHSCSNQDTVVSFFLQIYSRKGCDIPK